MPPIRLRLMLHSPENCHAIIRISWFSSIVYLVTVLALTSCSSSPSKEQQEYEVPKSLCGTAITASALKPLLPPGKTISSRSSNTTGLKQCRLSVDGKLAISSSIERWEAGTSLMKVASGTYGMNTEGREMRGDRYVLSGKAAVGHASCAKPHNNAEEVFTTVRIEHESANKSNIFKIIDSYTETVNTSSHCA